MERAGSGASQMRQASAPIWGRPGLLSVPRGGGSALLARCVRGRRWPWHVRQASFRLSRDDLIDRRQDLYYPSYGVQEGAAVGEDCDRLAVRVDASDSRELLPDDGCDQERAEFTEAAEVEVCQLPFDLFRRQVAAEGEVDLDLCLSGTSVRPLRFLVSLICAGFRGCRLTPSPRATTRT